MTVPGQATPQPPAGGGNGGSGPTNPNTGGVRPTAPQSVPPGDNTGQIPVVPSTAVPAVTTVPGAVTANPEPGTPPHALDSGSKQPEIPLAAWVVAGAAAFAAANPRARSRLSRYSKGLRIPGNYRTLADDEIPFPITDGREYAYPDEDLPIRGGWQGDVQVTGNMRYYPDPGQKTGTLTFSDNATPIVSNGDARMTRNKVRVWVNGKDVTDQAKIEYTPTGVKGHIKVNELDTVVVRHVSTMQWSEGSGNTRVNRTSNGDVLGIVKVVNDADAMDKALDIGNGHGFAKHQARGDLPRGITTRDEYIDMIYRTIRWAPPQDHKTLSNNREAWWNGQRGAVVIYDPNGEGTAFSPSAGRRYFDDKLR
ncbi:hypothetical protein [Gordonia polyisoprenivorans]|uniref:hypothetical protein n=1 Tax=Gordonia polyisoprenivorans TaxID=84595 RepID=UPI001AD7D114|nr:hypothetical protein [Gordonia polyisoprenivorans]QTI69867.1 hypothetical protein J6U32_04525 [Gordonia polyisoprenivorans]